MLLTTPTGRTVQIQADTDAYITYRNVKDGAACGPTRTANRESARAGSVGREILDALSEHKAAEAVTLVERQADAGYPARATGFEGNQLASQVWKDMAARQHASETELMDDTKSPAAPKLNGTELARLRARLAAEWPQGVLVTGEDDLGRVRVGTVQPHGYGVTETTGRTYIRVMWHADTRRGLKRRYTPGFTDNITRM